MSAKKNNKILVNCSVQGNYIHAENRNTEKEGREKHCKASKLKHKRLQGTGFSNKTKKCDALWITPFGETACCNRNRDCKERNCTAKWIKLERHFSKASTGVISSHNKNTELFCAIPSKNVNGEQNCSVSRTNQAKCQNNYEKHLSRQSGNKRRKLNSLG